MFEKKNDKYVMFYAKQGMALGVLGIVVFMAMALTLVLAPFAFIWNLVCLVLWFISVRNAFSGRMTETPVVGWLGRKF